MSAGTEPALDAVPAARVTRHVLVVAGGDVGSRAELDAAWPGWDAGVEAVVAADGGLARAEAIGLRPTLLVGDLDSLAPDAVARAHADGLPIARARPDKDESDTELAVLEAVGLGATRITLLGVFGGERLDHGLANLVLLAHPALAGIDVVELDQRTRVRLVTAPAPDGGPVTCLVAGPVGGLVSLLPLGGDVTGVTTGGLRYPLADELLALGPARGLSNERTAPDAAVTVRAGRLLVVEIAVSTGGLSSGA
jgi:thiamine pyrophosphokinase